MHYHYFTLEQRNVLAELMRSRIEEPGMAAALDRLRTPDYGVCESCGGDIPYARLALDPQLARCPACITGL
ncbi:MAG TPA: TraR/DksA C4-type zinc finger protein [Burkholderiales bacterium]|nr:TraR/DksA C4-type zinc finger protein [Burkholderiales bacterium]